MLHKWIKISYETANCTPPIYTSGGKLTLAFLKRQHSSESQFQGVLKMDTWVLSVLFTLSVLGCFSFHRCQQKSVSERFCVCHFLAFRLWTSCFLWFSTKFLLSLMASAFLPSAFRHLCVETTALTSLLNVGVFPIWHCCCLMWLCLEYSTFSLFGGYAFIYFCLKFIPYFSVGEELQVDSSTQQL